ncbi:MAG TPA: GNAT family N-acetyltransferase [Actinomycetota bacterium]|nr:GNAT family N-acetyltransferase [Actinomycetota bacterium]
MGDRGGLRLLVRPRLGPLEPAWDALVERLPLPSPFLRSWWLEQTARGVPRFLLVVDAGELVGGLALQEERWLGVPRLRVMGAGALCPDHLDLVALPGREEDVAAALAAWLRRPGSRVLDLEGVAGGSRLAAALPSPVRREVVAVAPWAPLTEDPDEWLRTRPRGFRATLRKAARRLDEQAAAHRVLRGAQVDAALAALRRLHGAQWGERSNFLAAYDRFAAASRAGASRGEVVVHELAAGDEVVAVVSCFEVAGRVSLYQSGRLCAHGWRNAATVLLVEVIRDACRRGLTEVDLLRGDEPYKAGFASAARELLRLRAAHGAAGRLALAALVLGTAVRKLAGRRLRLRRRRALPAPSAAGQAAGQAAPQGVRAHGGDLGLVRQR